MNQTASEVAVRALEDARALVEPALRRAVDLLDPRMRAIAGYHFGWLDRDGNPSPGNGGKALRSGLAIAVARALGTDPAVAIPGAVAVELIHNFSLIHDDLIDRDRERRHRPTVWAAWDDTTAILLGDALVTLAYEVIADSGSQHAAPAAKALSVATRELVRGQADDVLLESRDRVDLADCVSVAAGKTGALIAVSAALPAIFAGRPAEDVRALDTFGADLGLAFQIVDDLLGIWGTTKVTGKPVHADLAAGKKTIPVVYAMDRDAEVARWYAERDSRAEASPEELDRIAQRIEAAGGRDWAESEADRYAAAALAALTGAGLEDDVVVALAAFVTQRRS